MYEHSCVVEKIIVVFVITKQVVYQKRNSHVFMALAKCPRRKSIEAFIVRSDAYTQVHPLFYVADVES